MTINPSEEERSFEICTMAWEEMSGSEKVRFCPQCSRNVFNVPVLSDTEADELLAATQGRICLRFDSYGRRPPQFGNGERTLVVGRVAPKLAAILLDPDFRVTDRSEGLVAES
ncbi:MAG TPA: hypothetical protein VG944_11560 [Fimbriimonas sp.]|nr:hypothetical protein [Fimbriimonas sp.]